MSTAAIRPFVALLRRELWEHRAFWIVPSIISAVLTATGLYQLTFGGLLGRVDQARAAEHIDRIGQATFQEMTDLVSSGFLGLTFLFDIGLVFALMFYLLDSLYSDRRDRSFLFWKSMPVSDSATVLSKLATATVVAPTITLGVVAVTVALWSLLFSAFALWVGAGYWWVALNPLAYLDFIATAIAGTIVLGLIFSPFIGWLLLVSAWARKTPFLWAVLPPLILAWVEEFIFDSNHFIETLANHVGDLGHRAFDVAGRAIEVGDDARHMRVSMVDVTIDPGVLLEPRLWAGVVLAAALVAAAVYMRRYRDDA
jgi:ABC-2 type transport system permease protein